MTIKQRAGAAAGGDGGVQKRGLLAVLSIAGGLIVLIAALALVEWLWINSLLHWRTPVLVTIAVAAHLRQREQPSILVSGLHLAAIESSVTDLMGTGPWSMGWGVLSTLNGTGSAGLVMIAVSAAAGYRRLASIGAQLKRLWPIAVFSGVVGTAVGREVLPPLVWAGVGTGVSLLALVWMIDMHNAWLRRRSAESAEARGALGWSWPDHFAGILAIWVFASSAVISVMVFDAVPHVPDEAAYWFHAKYFAAGYLWLPSPPDWSAFSIAHTLNESGRWYSIFPPGWPAVLALGVMGGVPTLVNPLIAAITIVVLHRLLVRIYGQDTANVACGLLALSPAFLFMSAGLMSHPVSALCAVTAANAVHRPATQHGMIWNAVAGIAIALLFLTRPFEGVIIGGVFGVYLLSRRPWRSRTWITSVAVFVLSAAVGPAVMLAYNHALTGNALNDPITKYFDTTYYPGSNRLGFGETVGNVGWGNDMLPGHSVIEAFANAQLTTQAVNSELFAWACGSLVVLLLYAAWSRRLWLDADLLFLLIAAGPVVGHLFYWYHAADYGARYWYQVVIPCAVLSARALTWSTARGQALVQVAAVASVVGLLVFLPWRASAKYVGYRGVGDSVVRLRSQCGMTGGLVAVRDAAGPERAQAYASAALLNRPGFVGNDPVFAKEISDDVSNRLQASFADRDFWVIEVPADPRSDARIVRRPSKAPPSSNPACRPAADPP
jgi:hypothetical protein